MNNGIGEDCDELDAESDDGVRSPNGPAPSGYFGWNKFSGVVHHIVNKFSRVVPKTVSAPPMTAESPNPRSHAHAEDGNEDQSCEMRDRNDTQVFSPYQMNLRGMGADGSRVDRATGWQSDVGAGVGSTRFYPQFRKESSNFTKNASDTINHSPSYSSPSSGPVGQMPVVHLSPRQRPLLLRNEDRVKPVMVKIAQQDPLRSTLMIRHQSGLNINESNNSSTVDTSALTETVVDALKKKRKRQHLNADENETQDHEGDDQLSKRICSRDDDAAAAAAGETALSRGLKRRALHNAFVDDDDITDQSEDVVEGAAKKVCQNSSPSPRRSGCGVRDVISASYSSHLRWEERINRAKSRSQSRAASSQDESMPFVEDGGPSSSWASRCSSHFSRLSRANSPVPRDEDLRVGIRSTHSLQGSDRSTPLNLLHRLNDLDSASSQRAPLLVRDGSVKNRVTMLSGGSTTSVTPLPDLESRLMDSSESKASVEFTADDLERDRDLLNSRASRLLLGFMETEDETDGVVEPASTTAPAPTTTGGFTLGQASSLTTFRTSGATPTSATVTAGATDHPVQTNTVSGIADANVLNSGIAGANVLNSKIDGTVGPSISTATVSHNPFVSTTKQDEGGFSGSIAANAGFKFGSSSASVVCPSANPAISTTTVSSTGIVTTTQDSSGSQGKPLAPSESVLKGFGAGASSFGAFSVPLSGASDQGKPGSASGLNGQSFAPGALTTAAASTAVAPAFGTLSNVQTTGVSFGNVSNSVPKVATNLGGAFPTLGDTRATSGFFGGASAVGNSAVAATTAASASKDNAQMTMGGFAFGKPGGTQATGDNLGNAKPLVVTAQTTASGLSFENSSTAPTTASGFSFGNSGTTLTTANSFSFPNAGANQTTASNFAFGSSDKTQTTASSSAFGNLGATQKTASSFSFGTLQTPANNISFGNSGMLQTTTSSFATGTSQAPANSFSFGNSGNAQATANNLSFGNSSVAQPAVGGFGFGNASTNLTTGNMSGSVPTTVNSFGFGNSGSNQMVAGTFGNSGNVQTTANSSFAAAGAAPQFSFGKSPAPATANPSTAGGFGFGNAQQHQTSSNNPTTANPFGNSMPTANAFGSSSAAPSTFGSNLATVNTFGSNAAAPNAFGRSSATTSTFGSNVATANSFGSNTAAPNTFGNNATTANTFGNNATATNIFGGNSTTASTFGSTQPSSNPFNNTAAATANPFGGSLTTANPFGTMPNNNFDNKSSALQFNRPDVAATSQSTPQDLRRVLFPSTPSNNNSTLGSNMQATQSQQQQQSAFNFFGTKTDANSNSTNSPGGFAFGKNSTPAPTFGSNSSAGGFAFGKTGVGSTQAQPANSGFNFQGTNSQMPNTGFNAVTPQGVNSQAPNVAFNFQNAGQPMANASQAANAPFNFSASAPNFAFGQMSNQPASNGLPSIASFGAGPKFTPGTTYGPTSSTRSLRKKKGR